MNAKLSALCLLAVATLAACGQHQSDTPSTNSAASAPASAPASDVKSGKNSDAAKAFADAQKATETAQPKADPGVPVANYTTVDQSDGGTWLTYVAVSRATPQPGDDELLGMFSPRYFNEPDVFKKHDLVATELPPVKSNLQRYANQAYYAMPFGDPTGTSLNMNFFFQSGYDFTTKSFQMSSGQCWNMVYTNRQNVALDLTKTGNNLCQLPVQDEAVAKQIEQLRAANKLSARGLVYFHVDGIQNGNRVLATATHLHIDLYDAPAWDKRGKVFASFDL
jgi:hypothetical protein